MHATTTCPTTEELKKLLDSSLSGEQQQAFTAHMDSCVVCQHKLEELAVGGTNLTSIVQNLHDSEPLATSAYWPALRAVEDGLGQTVTTPPETRLRDASLSFLGPATDAAYLGRIGHFDVMRILGRGGMGVVLEAFDTKLQRHVAIKVLDGDLSKDELARQRFCREARAAASIAHENVVAVHQVERICEDGVPFLVMQLVNGETLEQRLLREKKLSVPEVVRIGMQAARGLAAAHAQGLIHRDIKPGNILLEAPNSRVKLTDFGLARVSEDVRLTRTGFVTGTPLYMSPEQALGKEADQRSDLFSLGAILYEMLAGQTPFQGNSALSILRQITEVRHRPLREVNPDVPEWLEELVDELLAKNPDDRYQTATDLAEVLEYSYAKMTNESLVMPAVCQVEVARRASRRRMLLAVAGAGLLSIGLVAGMLGSWFLPARGVGPTPEQSSAEPIAVLGGNAGSVWAVSFDPTSDTVAMGVEDGTVRLWDLPSKSVKATLDAHRGVVWTTRISDDGQLLVTSGDDGLLKLWRPTENAPLRTFDHPNAVRGLAMNADATRLYAGDRKGGLRVWGEDESQPLAQAEQPGAIYAVALSPDQKTLATSGSDKTVRLWNAETLTQKLPLDGHSGPVYSLAFSHDGTQLASAGWDRTVRIWDVSSGMLLKSWEASKTDIWAVAFSPDDRIIATAGQEGAVRLWSRDSNALLASFLGHDASVHALAFSRDGTKLASGGRDGAARVWEVPK